MRSWQVVHRGLALLAVDYGMSLVLLVVAVGFSVATLQEQPADGPEGGRQLARLLARRYPTGGRVVVVARETQADAAFAQALADGLAGSPIEVAAEVRGRPAELRHVLERLSAAPERIDALAVHPAVARWPLLQELPGEFPSLRHVEVLVPRSHVWPSFLKADNLLNIANQIAVIAIMAVGMTMVVIAGGIDLSVGSLMALAAVVATRLIRDLAGAEQAGAWQMAACCVAAMAICGLMGLFSGMITTFAGIPAFIATLAMMLVASGLAYMTAEGESIYELPEVFVWLGRGADLAGIPNAVVLMLLLYAAAQVLMTRTVAGRYIYAVGGNREAARLAGVPVERVTVLVYVACGVLAGLGGVVMASQLKSGAPTYGQMYELYVIAAVVVGGTSLSGGEGQMIGTLLGALLIAVIQNGMNLTGVESYQQKVVLGSVILAAVLIDRWKRRLWQRV
ncbi:MAG: ABC transporter permease [Pirellulales bacterium]|nr:ABC transporter permease [Pirellulales bacterium]